MRHLLLAAAVSLAAGAATASTETEVKQAAREFDAAQLNADRAALERFLAQDFVFVRGSGVVAGRDAFLASFASGTLKLDPFTVINPVFVDLGPDAAIVGGEATLTGTENGERFVERFRYADTFKRRDGRWQVVYVQVTPLPKA